ncbi:MAG: hypothetical protein ACI8WB_000718 [Phenylobacterium sp.]|jgi:hypothetical protein
MDKEIFELTREDIEKYPVWYFPMDDSVEDELTIRPFKGDCGLNEYQVIVKTTFQDVNGKAFVGYIYWSMPNNIEDIKPVVFTSNDECLTFWNGLMPAAWSDYSSEQQKMKQSLPLKYSSNCCQGLSSISGIIEGLYYIDGNNTRFI